MVLRRSHQSKLICFLASLFSVAIKAHNYVITNGHIHVGLEFDQLVRLASGCSRNYQHWTTIQGTELSGLRYGSQRARFTFPSLLRAVFRSTSLILSNCHAFCGGPLPVSFEHSPDSIFYSSCLF
jgi:hypothetical protein